jgi:hypothetical protein
MDEANEKKMKKMEKSGTNAQSEKEEQSLHRDMKMQQLGKEHVEATVKRCRQNEAELKEKCACDVSRRRWWICLRGTLGETRECRVERRGAAKAADGDG